MSRESPFLKGTHYEKIHPSTHIVFGEPEKKVRPYASKVNSLLRKSFQNGRSRVKQKKNQNPDPAFQKSFGSFSKNSMSAEKQKIFSFMFGTTTTLK